MFENLLSENVKFVLVERIHFIKTISADLQVEEVFIFEFMISKKL